MCTCLRVHTHRLNSAVGSLLCLCQLTASWLFFILTPFFPSPHTGDVLYVMDLKYLDLVPCSQSCLKWLHLLASGFALPLQEPGRMRSVLSCHVSSTAVCTPRHQDACYQIPGLAATWAEQFLNENSENCNIFPHPSNGELCQIKARLEPISKDEVFLAILMASHGDSFIHF